MSKEFLEELFTLQDEVAVVVGGTGELCGALAEGFARAGAKVVLVGRDREKADRRLASIRGAGGEGLFVQADAGKKGDLERVAQEARKAFGKITIAVNGAGANSPTPFLEITEEEMDRILATNYKAVAFGCQVFGKAMIDQKQGGAILNISSVSAFRALSKVFTYSATKAALVNLTFNLAREWAALGLRVNALAPGFFPAEQSRKILTGERIAKVMAHTPMGRFGEPRELVGSAIFLCARKAGSFVTGCHLTVDGGFTAMEFS
jgi:NAD(P)-dependent dehydrogenase (short-subunit alcohol dehydrogenase family)